MARKKILFIGGSLNQTTMMHKISQHLSDSYACYFTPHYADGMKAVLNKYGYLDFTVMGGKFKQDTMGYLRDRDLRIDEGGKQGNYALVVTGSDLLVQKNIRKNPIVLVQEGMTDEENIFYHMVKWFKLPRWLAGTASMGLSDAYAKFCVASEGYRDYFIKKGVNPQKITVTGIPNFDNVKQFLDNDFPYKNYVLAATSDMRETFKYDNRKKFIQRVGAIADGRQIIFKLHPNENFQRARKEIHRHAPGALIFEEGNTAQMIANCDVLFTQFSTVVYIGLLLGKECYSYFDLEHLRKLLPLQNDGSSAKNIADICRSYLDRG